jgi:hypothetical protein
MAKKKTIPLPPTSEAREEVLKMMRRTDEPVTARQLSGRLVAPFRIAEAILAPILDEFVANGSLRSIPAATAKGKPRYWDRDLVRFGQLMMVKTLDKKGPQTRAKLQVAVKGLDSGEFQQAFQGLLDSQGLRAHPPLGNSKILKYGTQPPSPEPYLQDWGIRLLKVVEQLTAVGVGRDALSKATLAWLIQAGLPVGPVESSSVPSPASSIEGLDLLMLMRQIEPGAERGALVAARELRRAANLDKPQFDQAVLGLARQGRLMLHRHDYANGLSSSDRDELVTDGAGAYYVGMALRRTEG